ncbi:MAG: hypothetical protein IIX46_04700 [Bacteroidaceae bacterium]|nr:hypothetical protein [Bacteroidaceae bacterium]
MEKINKASCPVSFDQLLKAAQVSNEYVGCGNPNASILIIASEPAIAPDEERYEWEMAKNNEKWLTEGVAETIVHDGVIDDISKFSPRFPYKGQKYSVRSEVKKDEVTHIRSVAGTSRTWYNYQKLLDLVRGVNRSKAELLDFHDWCFTSEVNTCCAKKSSEVDEEGRRLSIAKRAGKSNRFFSSDFFQGFPIVIVASRNYVHRYRDVFSVGELFGFPADCKRVMSVPTRKGGRNWHLDIYTRQGDSPKLLICCTHFANRMSEEYMKAIASTIREFCAENKIQI